MSKLTLWKIVERGLLYIGIALLVLVVVATFIVLTKGRVRISGGWAGLVTYTALLLWVIISKSRKRWHQLTFWLTVVGLLTIHLLAFVAILRSYPQWRMIWFVPVVIVEAGLFSVILNVLLGPSTR
ncbi:MAG TPA: hypothetical protein VFF64_01180 [Candidatus Eremiobacteraceae bacterium]|nr:hypothetical protein [Candidatus Eremiobacteraceae bacterium]